MLNLEPVTIYHITDEDTGEFTRIVYDATVHKTQKQISEKGGFITRDVLKIRFPGTSDVLAEIDDYVYIGNGPEELKTPDCFKITFVADNRRGALPHIRIEAV